MEAYDVVVIGSGFGGSVAGLRLTEKGYRVAVLEAGRPGGPRIDGEPHQAGPPSTSVQLLPPKPKELVITGPVGTRRPLPASRTGARSGSVSPS